MVGFYTKHSSSDHSFPRDRSYSPNDIDTVDEAPTASLTVMEESSFIIGDKDHNLYWEGLLSAVDDSDGMDMVTELVIGDGVVVDSGINSDDDGLSSLSLMFPDAFQMYNVDLLSGHVLFDEWFTWEEDAMDFSDDTLEKIPIFLCSALQGWDAST